MVVSEGISVNTFFTFNLNSCNIPQEHYISILMDIKVNTPRGWSSSFSTNNSREILLISNVSSTAYIDYVQILANSPTWAEQVEQGKIKESAFSYITLKKKTDFVNQTNTTELMSNLYRTVINDTCPS